MEISVPLGTLSGITFFGGVGPNITVRCIPVGSVNVSFKSVFTAAGINNTLHSIVMSQRQNGSFGRGYGYYRRSSEHVFKLVASGRNAESSALKQLILFIESDILYG